ncbi:ABC transporter sub-family A-like protein 2 [Sarcoptes scabiei]|uniref:ABC transporter sub-family A-like protein 2 n=1 Tax=Sarcoptes scabiei TaxID=52283 RepID=A0A131ZV21_SARSC|nr:ABC transporter sub-family A-like protein 2 [Sarcoptes scabiei]
MTITSSAVDVENLSFSYKRHASNLESINMHVPRGTIYGLLGPSGCGKTTLLRCIVGRLKPRCGSVAVFGYQPGTRDCGIPGPNIGYMPQELSLISQFTVRETLEYYAGFAKQNAQIESRIQFLLRLLDINDFENCYTDRLSGGQQRRVSLAVSMINEPPLLILDEPTVGVDPILRESIWSHLVDQSKNGLTVIVTTHYIEEAGSADKVGFMRQGRILAEGNPSLLMLQNNVVSMERLFLKLSQEDDFRHPNYSNDLLVEMDRNSQNFVLDDCSSTIDNNTSSLDPSTMIFSNGSASFTKSRAHFLQLSPPSLTTFTNTKCHSLEAQKNPIEHYKQLDPDSLIEPRSFKTHSLNANSKLNNNDYMDAAKSFIKISPCSNKNLPTSSNKSRSYSVHGQNRSVNSFEKINVLCRKHRIRLFRRVPELIITMLLPALEVALFCLCMGRDPTSVQMAVCNQEDPPFLSLLFLKSIDSDFIALKYYKTPEEAIDSVRNADTYSAIVLAKNFSNVLRHFGQNAIGPPMLSPNLNDISNAAKDDVGSKELFIDPLPHRFHPTPSTITSSSLPSFSSSESSVNSINHSELSATDSNPALPPLMTPFIVPSKPTQSMFKTTDAIIIESDNDLRRTKRNISDLMIATNLNQRLANENQAEEEESIIRIYYDGSNALHVNIIRREVFSALFRFVEIAGKTFGGQMHGYKLPIKFEKPIYGGEKTDMVEFVGPGLMVFIVFFATMSITSMAFLSERREGTLERSMIVGLTPTEFIIAQIINITFLLIVQITLTVVMGFWIFEFPMKGSYVLAVAMMNDIRIDVVFDLYK